VPGTSRSGDDDPISSSVSGCSPRRPVPQKHCTGTTTYVAPSSMRIRAAHKLRVRMHCDIDYARPHTCRFTRPGPATPASGEPWHAYEAPIRCPTHHGLVAGAVASVVHLSWGQCMPTPHPVHAWMHATRAHGTEQHCTYVGTRFRRPY